jgi:hypothetical protein
VFDSQATIEIQARTAGGLQKLEVRWPNDEEWGARAKGRKIVIKRLGRGMSETSIEPGESDLKLYEKIMLNGSPQLTKGEATRVVDVLAVCDVTDVIIEGDEAAVELNVLGGTVKHTVKIPTAEQVISFRRSAFRLLDLPFNKQQMVLNPDAGAKLWDACAGKSGDYSGPVPVLHKDQAIRGVIEYLDREVGMKDDPNF